MFLFQYLENTHIYILKEKQDFIRGKVDNEREARIYVEKTKLMRIWLKLEPTLTHLNQIEIALH